MSLLADLTQNILLGKLGRIILWLDQIDLVVLLHPLGGDAVTLLLLYVS